MPLRSGGRPVASRAAFQAREPPAHLQRGPHRVLGVPRPRDRRAEDRLDLVADELQHQAAVGRGWPVSISVKYALRSRTTSRGSVASTHGVKSRRSANRIVASRSSPSQRDAAGQDLVADLLAHVLAEGLAQELALAQAPHHAIEALGDRADLVVARPPGTRTVKSPRPTSAIAVARRPSGSATLRET